MKILTINRNITHHIKAVSVSFFHRKWHHWHNIWTERTEVAPAPVGWKYWNSKMRKDWSDTESVFFQTTQNPELPLVSSLQLYCFNVKNKKRCLVSQAQVAAGGWSSYLDGTSQRVCHRHTVCPLNNLMLSLQHPQRSPGVPCTLKRYMQV